MHVTQKPPSSIQSMTVVDVGCGLSAQRESTQTFLSLEQVLILFFSKVVKSPHSTASGILTSNLFAFFRVFFIPLFHAQLTIVANEVFRYAKMSSHTMSLTLLHLLS